jgi:Tfp pilus assembly protein PilF
MTRGVRAIPLVRRLALAFGTLALCGVLFHGQVADALVTRGDGVFQAGDVKAAVRFYRRALWFDAGSEVATERLTGIALLTNQTAFVASVVDAAARELALHPGDLRVRQNRAVLLLRKLHREDEAYAEFRIVARDSTNPAIVEFVARFAQRRGDLATARAAYERTLVLDPQRASARFALARLAAVRD